MTSSDVSEEALELVRDHGWSVFRIRIGHNEKTCDGGTANCKTVDFIDPPGRRPPARTPTWSLAGTGRGPTPTASTAGSQDSSSPTRTPAVAGPSTAPRVHSTGRGKHHIYEDLIGLGNKAHLDPWGIDVRGDGGLIVGPGSWHPHGAYSVVSDVPVAPVPAELAEAAARRPERAEPAEVVPLAAFKARERLEGVYAKMAAAPNGTRNDALNKLAGAAAGLWVRLDEDEQIDNLTEDAVKQRLFESIPDDGDPEKSWSTIESGWEYGLQHPLEDEEDGPLEIPARASDGKEWLLNAIMPTRAYGILSGSIGSGKSSIAGYVVSELTKAGFRVRYCVEDEPEISARHRLVLLGADMSRVKFDGVPDLTTEEDMERYARSCAKDGTDLMVLDLLQTANLTYEENRPEKVKQWVGKLVERFCHTYGVGILGTHHWNNNSKAGSVMARLSGAGAIAAKAEFFWSVAISNDKTEQVWSVHARRRVSVPMNFEMKGTRHVVEQVEHPFRKSETIELDVYTVQFGFDVDRTAHQVASEAESEFSKGGRTTSKERVEPDALLRFLETARRRSEVDEFLYWSTGERYSPQTVVDRIRDAGAVQCTAEGEPVERGKYWIWDFDFR